MAPRFRGAIFLLLSVMLVRQKLTDFLKSRLRLYSVISITGAGGKTTLLTALATHYKSCDTKLMLTTTTHLSKNYDYKVDEIITGPLSYNGSNSVLYVHEDEENKDKYKTPGVENINKLSRYFSKTIIEADGARGLPLKYHALRDPVIATSSQITLIVLGLDSLGKKIDKVMCGADEYFDEFPKRINCSVDFIDIENLFNSKNGIFKSASPENSLVFLNKFDCVDNPLVLKKVINFSASHNFIVSSFEKNEFIYDNML